MNRLFQKLLGRAISRGNLRITTAGGSTFAIGDGSGSPVAIRFTTDGAEWGVLIDPELKLGEAYVDGGLVVEQGSITDLLALVLSQPKEAKLPYWARVQWLSRYIGRRLHQFNSPRRAQRNVAHHYDLDDALYRLFLDADQQYSCAYFESPDQSLDDAQLAKKRHLAAKLLVRPNQRVLEIGSGWGGLSLYLSGICKARVTGITLSKNQLAVARQRAEEQGLSGQAEFRLQDYRSVVEHFDRIVTVGMFEHVGVGFYDVFFRKCAALLDEDGVIVLSAIGRSEGPNITNPWIAKYIFPGGHIPALSEVLPAIERAGLLLDDVEILRLHYAETLQAWRDRFNAHRDAIEQIYDLRFVRMWEFYLAASEMAFRKQAMMVFHLQLTKRQDVVPRNSVTILPVKRPGCARSKARSVPRYGWLANNI